MRIATRHLSDAGFTEPVSRLLPSAYLSLAVQAKEDAAIWTRAWVGLGFAADIAHPADILPVTVGNHGIHVERQADGTIIGRFNKAQHGGCRAVPLQCQTGTKTKCSFTACGYSRDRRPILSGDLNRLQHLDQYLGLRPERLLTVATHVWGPIVAARLDPSATSPLDWLDHQVGFDPVSARPCGETLWFERDANWKHAMIALATSDRDFQAKACFPNVVVLAAGDLRCCVVLHPTALHRTLCRVRFFVTGASGDPEPPVGEALHALSLRLERAEAWQGDGSRLGEDADTVRVRTWFEERVAAAFEALDDEERGILCRTNDKGVL